MCRKHKDTFDSNVKDSSKSPKLNFQLVSILICAKQLMLTQLDSLRIQHSHTSNMSRVPALLPDLPSHQKNRANKEEGCHSYM